MDYVKSNDPYFDNVMIGWLKKAVSKQFWRVATWYDFDDLLQDAFLCYAKCRKQYAHLTINPNPSKDERRHFMALVQTTFANYVHALATAKTETPDVPISQMAPDHEGGEEWVPDLDDYAEPENGMQEIVTLIAQAPAELQKLFSILMSDAKLPGPGARRITTPSGSRRAVLGKWSGRETTNEYLCRLAGFDPTKVNLVRMAKTHFGLASG